MTVCSNNNFSVFMNSHNCCYCILIQWQELWQILQLSSIIKKTTPLVAEDNFKLKLPKTNKYK
jgi:hypothetical protein